MIERGHCVQVVSVGGDKEQGQKQIGVCTPDWKAYTVYPLSDVLQSVRK